MWCRRLRPVRQLVVFITGCDSGVGFRMAVEATRSGLTVVAGFLHGTDQEAAVMMREQCESSRLHQVRLDVTDDRSVDKAAEYVGKLLKEDYVLHAVVNNAGVMVFGHFEWQTTRQLEYQVSVNMLGVWRVSKAFLPLLRSSGSEEPRLITVTSHCGIQPLPALSAYAATKFALNGWMEALRMELQPSGVHVLSFIPGSLVMATNIVSRQRSYADEMSQKLDPTLRSYFDVFMSYICQLSFEKPADAVDDGALMEKFMASLLDRKPSTEYMNRVTWRYAIYHFLFAITPMRLRYWLVNKFTAFPSVQ